MGLIRFFITKLLKPFSEQKTETKKTTKYPVNKTTNYSIINQTMNSEKSKKPSTVKLFSKRSDITYVFDMDDMQYTKSWVIRYFYGMVDYYIIPEYYRQQIKNYIDIVNKMLKDMSALHPQIPLSQYCATDINILSQHTKEYEDVCMFYHHPVDAKNKQSLTPYSIELRFEHTEGNYCQLFFDKDGDLKSGALIYHPQSFNEFLCYRFIIGTYEDKLQIISAFKITSGNEERIFDYKYEQYLIRKKEYQWICDNLPNLAPKSMGGYTRMKNLNSEKYQTIKKIAAEKGKILS